MKKKIKYITFYNEDNENDTRECSPAAINKSKYIIETLNNIGYDVDIISPAWSNKKKGFYKGKIINKKNNKFIKFNSFGGNNKILRFLRRKYAAFQLTRYLLKNTSKNETIIFYHSNFFYKILKKLKVRKKIDILLEVEEIYGDIIKNKKSIKYESKIFNLANNFIFVTNQLEKKVNKLNKKYCVAHGTYKVEDKIIGKYSDDKVHIVYSGIIDKYKGSFLSCEIAKYLDENYVIHIIGYGKEKDIFQLEQKIKKNNSINKCKINYDGLKTGEEYIKYLQNCDVGLSTQDVNARYNLTSFPSKILAYLSNGLRVISIDIPAIRTSDVGDILYYYKNNDPEEIAEIIKNIDFNKKYDSRKLISKLDKRFCKDLEKMLGEINNDK